MSAHPGFRTTIRLRGVSKAFAAGSGSCRAGVAALGGASVEIRGGEVLLVCGPAGAGKTTLLLCAAGLLHFDTGEISGTRRGVVYRDLSHPTPALSGWPAGGAILLDSCDDVGELVRATVARAVARALGTGSAIVVAARDPEKALALTPAAASVSVIHLRLGQVNTERTEIGVVHRVAEGAGGGY